jgi:predicted alpha/beta hydrolase
VTIAESAGRPLPLHTADGQVLQATLHEPAWRAGRHVLVAGGLGVPQRVYAPFAAWLARQGHRVLTFDLRGTGASRGPEYRRSLRGLDADMLTWARLDFGAAVDALSAMDEDRPIAVIGHSLGTHHAAMTEPGTQGRIDTVVAVAAGSGYWRDWAPPSRRLAPLMLHLAAPLITPLLGYFPGKALRMVGDMPAPAIRQWARWCRHPDFAWGAEPDAVLPSLRAARFRIEAFRFTDDEAMTETCTRKLLAAMPHARSTLHTIDPARLGLRAIGHAGAFRRSCAGRLWPMLEAALARGADAGCPVEGGLR